MKSNMRLLGAAFFALAFGQAFAADPVVDGTLDAGVYTLGAVQNTQTGWGDNNLGQVGPANGSELDNVYYYRTATDLYLFIGGNMQNEPGVYQKAALFFDIGVAGYNKLPGGLPDIDFNRLQRFGDDGTGNGLTFDTGFNAGHFVGLVCGGNAEVYFNYAQVETVTNGGIGNYVGGGTCGSDGTLSGGNNPNNALFTVNNSNVAGVPGGIGTDPGNGAGVTTGLEVRIPLAMIGNPNGDIKLSSFIYSDGYDFVSNQFLGGIGGGDNLGEPRVINLSVVPGDQYITIPGGGATTETLAPSGEAILLGAGSGGTLASWAADDNDARTVCKFFVPNATSPFVRVNLNYTTTKTAPTAVSFDVKVSVHTPGPQSITLLMQNKVNSAFVATSVNGAASINGTTYNGVPTGALADYVGGGGAMTGQIEIRQTGPSTALLPCSSFEFGQMVVTG